jgi:N-acetylmuramoyl-L-alanine amidase
MGSDGEREARLARTERGSRAWRCLLISLCALGAALWVRAFLSSRVALVRAGALTVRSGAAAVGRPQAASRATVPARRQMMICLDPGHPSEVNSGTALQNGLQEVSVNWGVATRLRQVLLNEGYNVQLTKSL